MNRTFEVYRDKCYKRAISPREEWARLYVDQSDESRQAEKLLREARFCVITFPINGKMGPELKFGRYVYRSLKEIKDLIKKIGDSV